MIVFGVLPVFLLLQVLPVVAGEKCQYGYSSYYSTSDNSRWCDDGCCGTKYSDYSSVCCYEDPVVPVGVIAGCVVGGLAGLAILIGVIVCCCVAVRRSGRRPGMIIQSTATNAHAVVVSNTAFTHGPPPNPGPYGPASIALGVAPPGYSQYNNPAYPPPPLSKY